MSNRLFTLRQAPWSFLYGIPPGREVNGKRSNRVQLNHNKANANDFRYTSEHCFSSQTLNNQSNTEMLWTELNHRNEKYWLKLTLKFKVDFMTYSAHPLFSSCLYLGANAPGSVQIPNLLTFRNESPFDQWRASFKVTPIPCSANAFLTWNIPRRDSSSVTTENDLTSRRKSDVPVHVMDASRGGISYRWWSH